MKKLSGLIKIGSKEYMEDFLYNGTLFFQKLSFYRSIENGQRGDQNEGISYSFTNNNPNLKVEITTDLGDKVLWKGTDLLSPITGFDNALYDPLIYCMFAIPNGFNTKGVKKIPKECHDFGRYAVVICDTDKFLKRVECEFKKTQQGELSSTLVKYVNPKVHSGNMGPFFKYDNFIHQNEFRILHESFPKKDKNNKLMIDNIEDIAVLCPTEKIQWHYKI